MSTNSNDNIWRVLEPNLTIGETYHAQKEKVRKFKRKINPNPVPRDEKDLPDFDQLMKDYEPTIAKIVHDIRKKWFQQIKIHEIKKEIRATAMLIICVEWDLYKRGIIDEFPPYAGYLYKSAYWEFHMQFAPKDDLTRFNKMEFYNCVEGGVVYQSPNIIPTRGIYQDVATTTRELTVKCDNIPLKDPPDKYQQPYGNMPDIVDWWYLGCTVRQLAVIYRMSQSTILKHLHDKYDAMLFAGTKPRRARPRRQKKRMGRFHPRSDKNPQKNKTQ